MTFEKYLAKTDYPMMQAEARTLRADWEDLAKAQVVERLCDFIPLRIKLTAINAKMIARSDATRIEYDLDKKSNPR